MSQGRSLFSKKKTNIRPVRPMYVYDQKSGQIDDLSWADAQRHYYEQRKAYDGMANSYAIGYVDERQPPPVGEDLVIKYSLYIRKHWEFRVNEIEER